jgi:hypothetical protein
VSSEGKNDAQTVDTPTINPYCLRVILSVYNAIVFAFNNPNACNFVVCTFLFLVVVITSICRALSHHSLPTDLTSVPLSAAAPLLAWLHVPLFFLAGALSGLHGCLGPLVLHPARFPTLTALPLVARAAAAAWVLFMPCLFLSSLWSGVCPRAVAVGLCSAVAAAAGTCAGLRLRRASAGAQRGVLIAGVALLQSGCASLAWGGLAAAVWAVHAGVVCAVCAQFLWGIAENATVVVGIS